MVEDELVPMVPAEDCSIGLTDHRVLTHVLAALPRRSDLARCACICSAISSDAIDEAVSYRNAVVRPAGADAWLVRNDPLRVRIVSQLGKLRDATHGAAAVRDLVRALAGAKMEHGDERTFAVCEELGVLEAIEWLTTWRSHVCDVWALNTLLVPPPLVYEDRGCGVPPPATSESGGSVS